MAHPYPQRCATHPKNLEDDPPAAIRYASVQHGRWSNVHLKASSGARFPRLDFKLINSHCAPRREHSLARVLGWSLLLCKHGLLSARANTRLAWDAEFCFPQRKTEINSAFNFSPFILLGDLSSGPFPASMISRGPAGGMQSR
jgi:hypothetical protein